MSRKIDLNKLQHKSAGDKLLEVADTGRFSGYASVFGVLDDQGEIIHKGAFADTLASYEEAGKRIPVIYLHNLKEPVGYIEKAVEDDVGLWVEGVIMHETSAKAAEAYSFVKEGVISEMSVGFYYMPDATVYDAEKGVTNIYKTDFREVSLVVIGSNSGSRIVAVKSAGEENELAELVKVDAILSGIVANQQQQALAKIAELLNNEVSDMSEHNMTDLAAKLAKAMDAAQAQGEDFVAKSANFEKLTQDQKQQMDETIKTLNETRLELDAVKQAIAGAEPDAKPDRAMTMGQKFAAKAGDFDTGNRAARMRMQMKAGEITNSVGSKPLGGVTNLGMRSPVDLPLVIRDLLTTIEIQTDSVEFSFIDTFTNNADMVAELAKKPQSELTFDMETLPTRVIAHFIKASKQALSDNTFLQGLIDNRLRRGLDAKIEQQLLLGDGLTQNLRGLLPNATAFSNTQLSTVTTPNRLDVIRLAMLQTVLSGYASNGIVLNPLDAFTIGLTKDDVGGYLISNPLATTGNMTLWGLPVIESTSMTADNFLVGDFKQAELYNRWDTTVEAGYENDDFTKNMVTLLCESRLALGIVDKLALVKGDFTTALA